MNRRFLPLLFSGALASSFLAVPAGSQAQAAPSKAAAHVEGELLVSWSGAGTGAVAGVGVGASPAQSRLALQNFKNRLSTDLPGASVARNFQGSGWSLVKVPPGLSSEAALARLAKKLGAANVSLNYERHAAKVPNDPDYGQQWHWPQIKAPEAWNYSTGSASVVVAVLDTGVDLTHPDLQANLWKNTKEIPGNGIDDDKNGYIDDVYGFNGLTGQESAPPQDDNGHGTHCAGLIGATGNNSLKVTGAAWSVKIMSLKFLDQFASGSDAGAIACLEYAIKMKKSGVNLRVISNSWSGRLNSAALKAEFQAAESAGILDVCAAGNGAGGGAGRDIDADPEYPAAYTLSSILSVGASTADDTLASYSNYGAKSVDLVAPGDNIVSLGMGGGEATMSGTSMATPIVAGAAALIASREPTLTAAQIKSRLLGTVDKFAAFTGKNVTGGRLNMYRAVANATLRISGKVYRTSGTTVVPLTGAIIKLNGKTLTSTDSNGVYLLKDLPPGNYTVLAALKNYGFTQVAVSLPRASGQAGAPNAVVDFPARTVPNSFYTISGRAVNPSGKVLGGVVIFMTGVPNAVASTNSNGYYIIRDRAFGTYSLTASAYGYNWRSDPTSITIPTASGKDPAAPNGTVNFFSSVPDTAAPQVSITTPADGVNRSPGSVTATGTATDQTGVAELYFQLTRTIGTTVTFYDWTNKVWTTNSSAAGIKALQKVSGTSVNWSQPLPGMVVASYSLRVWGADTLGHVSQGEADAVSSWDVVSSSSAVQSGISGGAS